MVGKRLCLSKISLCPVVKVQCAVHVGMLDSLEFQLASMALMMCCEDRGGTQIIVIYPSVNIVTAGVSVNMFYWMRQLIKS